MKTPTVVRRRSGNLIVPVWAEQIERSPSKNPKLIAVKAGRPWEAITSRTLVDAPPRDFLRDCGVDKTQSAKLGRSWDVPVAVSAFVEADTDEKLEEFVYTYGPVLAEIRSINEAGSPVARHHETGVIALQDRSVLQYEQRIFKSLWELCNALKKLDAWASGAKNEGRGGIEACHQFWLKYRNTEEYAQAIREKQAVERESLDALPETLRKDSLDGTFRRGRLITYEVELKTDPDRGINAIRKRWESFRRLGNYSLDPPRADVDAVETRLSDLAGALDGVFAQADSGDKGSAAIASLAETWRPVWEWILHWYAQSNDPYRLPPVHAVHYRIGKQIIAEALNQFPVKLAWIDFAVEDAPAPSREGIRPLLYYVLRRAFYDGVLYRRCATPGCPVWFHGRPNKAHHSEPCRKRHEGVRARAKPPQTSRTATPKNIGRRAVARNNKKRVGALSLLSQ